MAPLEFGQVVGLYLATLFVVWQVMISVWYWIALTLPIILGGLLVITGGAIITFWKPCGLRTPLGKCDLLPAYPTARMFQSFTRQSHVGFR